MNASDNDFDKLINSNSKRKNEELLIEYQKKEFNFLEKQRFQRYPEDWLIERLGENAKSIQWSLWDKEKYKNHKWDGTPEPFLEICKQLGKRNWVNVRSATGIGKTWFAARAAQWFLDTYEDSLVICTAPVRRQIEIGFWSELSGSHARFKKIRPKSELKKLSLRMGGEHKDSDDEFDGWQAIGMVASIDAGSKASTKMSGIHRPDLLIIIDEIAGIHPSILTALVNTCTGDNNIILGLSNPDSKIDQGAVFGRTDGVKNIRISALDFPNYVLDEELIPGAATVKSVERRKKTYGEDSGFFKSRVRGQTPDEAQDALIKMEWIMQCVEEADTIPDDGSLPALGMDVANSESGDMAALAWGVGNELQEIEEFQCPNATHLAYNVIYSDDRLLEKGYRNYNTKKLSDYGVDSDCIVVDSVGVGVAAVNAFEDAGWDEIISFQGGQEAWRIPMDEYGKPRYRFRSKRQQGYWELREDLRLKLIKIKIKDKTELEGICRELTAIKFTLKNEGIVISSKEDIKLLLGGKSPNKADAIMYWNWGRKVMDGGEGF